MIDIHSHILPGIDDGAVDIYDTLEMAEMAVQSGVTTMIATPHGNMPGVYENYYGKAYVEAFQKAREAIAKEGIPLELLPGMEVYATYDLPEKLAEGRIVTLNESHYILLEFDFEEDPDFVSELLAKTAAVGARPIIAHPERYRFLQDNLQYAFEWQKKGYLLQINRGSILGRFGRQEKKTAHSLLRRELASIVASDAHGVTRRTPHMQDVRAELLEEYPHRYVEKLLKENPLGVCEDRLFLRANF